MSTPTEQPPTGENLPAVPKNRGNAGKGRHKGWKNKLTRDSIQQIWGLHQSQGLETAQSFARKVIGIDDPDGKVTVNGRALKVRETIMMVFAEMGMPPHLRTIKFTDLDARLLALMMSYAWGMPGKIQPDKGGAGKRMPYIGRHGLPWQYDVMFEQQ